MSSTNTARPVTYRPPSRSRYRLTRRGKVVFALVPVLMVALLGLASAGGGGIVIGGVTEDAVLGAGEASPVISIATEATAENLMVTLDEQPLTASAVGEATFEVALADLADGNHTLAVVVDRTFPLGALEETTRFTVDTTPPALEIVGPLEPVPVGDQVVVRAQVGEDASSVTVDGEPVSPDAAGMVEAVYPEPPQAAVVIAATDANGNMVEESVSVELALAGAPGGPPIFGVHASGYTWATPILKDPIVEMIDAGLINTVQIDLKDEGGDIWYDTEVGLAHEIGAVTVLWDLAAVIEELHGMGVRVIARIVNFRDPRLATYAVESGNMSWVIQNPDGTAYGQYGGFTNPYNPDVIEYNIALAEEAARLGVDDVMFDYVRRPDTLQELVYPGQEGSPEDAIVNFLALSHERVGAAGARLGAAVFGIAATRPTEIAQDIPRMAEVIDFIAPMVYPSHWGPGEYGVDDPNSQPYDITFASLADFVELTSGTQASLIGWLQDFSLGVDYGPAEVSAQIQASRDAGVENILLWDAATTYTRAALDPLG